MVHPAVYWGALCAGIVILLILHRDDISAFTNREYVQSALDGKKYQIISSFEGGDEAANVLAKINEFLLEVLRHMKTKYANTNSKEASKGELTRRLLALYNPDVLREHNPRGTINTSYVTNKGDEIGFCLREKRTGRNRFHDFEILKFVALHEISHIATISYGHETDFWTIFKFIASEAVDAGLYNPVDYSKHPAEYCALEIDYSPLYDATLSYEKL